METIKNARDMIQLALGEAPSDFKEIQYTGMGCLAHGDLLMRRMGASKPYHAGIYCGNNEVIDFSAGTGQTTTASFSSLKHDDTYGAVQKISLKKFENGQKLAVFRLIRGAPKELANIIAKAMDEEIPYDVLTFNCVHFALCILKIKQWPSTGAENGAMPGDPEAGMLMKNIPERSCC